jgi:hypothetical protein
MQNPFNIVLKLPILGNVLLYCVYPFAKFILPVMARISGWRRLKFGTSIVLTPQDQEQPIRDGIECLRRCDPEMFSRFSKQRFNIAYSNGKGSANNGGVFFSLHERYIKLGPEGVAVFIVQCIMLAEASPSFNRYKSKANELPALKIALRKVLEWMQQRSFHPGLIDSYSKVVEKWEAGNRFQAL